MNIKLIAIIVFAIAIGGIVWHYKSTIEENKRLTNELKTANTTIESLDKLANAQRDIRNNERDLIDEIDRTDSAQDAPTAPVLLDAINRL